MTSQQIPERGQPRGCLLGHRRLVEQHAAQVRMARQHRRQSGSVAAADIDERVHAGEVVALGDRLRLPPVDQRLGHVEVPSRSGVLREVLEERHAVGELHARGSVLHRSRNLVDGRDPPSEPVLVLGGCWAEGSQREAPLWLLVEDPEHRERAQHAVQRRLVQPGHLGQLRARARAVEQTAGQLVPESDLEQLRHHDSAPHLEDLGAWWRRRCSVRGRLLRHAAHLASSREWPRPGGRGCPMTWINSAVRRRPHTNAASDMFRPVGGPRDAQVAITSRLPQQKSGTRSIRWG
jgi:hypothetical protein